MMFKALVLVGLLSSNAAAASLRTQEEDNKVDVWGEEQLDLELIGEGGERELFPLLPGTKCPPGHQCRVRTAGRPVDVSPMSKALKNSLKTPVTMTLDWNEFDSELKTVVNSENMCTRRAAMTRAAGMAAGLSAATVMQPAYAAETKTVKMGSDTGLLAFVPQKISICKGDTITWVMNKAGPHNVVFDEDAIPSGVDTEKISMVDGEQLGDEGDTFSRTFETVGEYSYYCEPHRGAGMNGVVTVV